MTNLDDYNFAGKKALIRVDFNVPLNENFEITDFTRIKAATPTIKKILADGGSAILMSHLGRPKTGPEDKFSLKHLVKELSERFGTEVKFATDCIGDDATELGANLKAGEVLLLENLRFYKEETKGDEAFAEKLSKLGDVYVNDAFGTAHRAHASTTIVAKFFDEKICGYVMQAELDNAEMVLNNPKRPFTAIMGGAKVSDKIMIIEKLLDKVDNLIIGGGMSYTFSKANGGSIGNSLCEDDKMELTKELVEKVAAKGVKLYLPVDNLIADDFSNDANTQVVNKGEIPDGWEGLDIGPETRKIFSEVVENSKTILWNGPMGVFEMDAFAKGTLEMALCIADRTEAGAFSVVGGGDSVAAVNKFNLGKRVSHVSTGGGAMLEYLEGKTLPGIQAILD